MTLQPKTPSGRWKRKQTEAMEEITGKKYCTSCRSLHPREKVKLYKSAHERVVMPRCDYCQEKRLEAMRRAA